MPPKMKYLGELKPRTRRCQKLSGPPTCQHCEARLTPENWSYYKKWAEKRPGHRYICRACSCKSFRAHPRVWVYRSVGRSNDRLPDARGKMTVAGMLAKFTGECHWCGVRLITTGNRNMQHDAATVDHVISVAGGGPNTDENGVWACLGCNLSRRDQPIDAWFGKMEATLRRHRPALFQALFSIPDVMPVLEEEYVG